MSYTAPSGSVWRVTNNYDINPTSGYYRAYTGEFRGSPNQSPQNEIQQSCSLACDSKPDCAAWSLDGNGTQCYIIHGNVTTLRSLTGRKAYVRTSARPVGKYSTIAQGVTLSTIGGHYCQGDGWAGDGEGAEVEISRENRYCVEPFPRPSRCPPDLGPPVTGNLVNKTNGGGINFSTGTNNVGVICTYNTVPDSVVFNDGKMSEYFGGSSRSGTTQQIRQDRCAQYNFSALQADTTTCKRFYDAQGTGTFDYELFKRIVSEGPTWITDAAKRQHVMTCITGSSVALATDAANLLLHRIQGINIPRQTYAGVTVTQPTDLKDTWGQYSEIVGFLNQLLRTPSEAAGAIVPGSIQSMVILAIRTYCTAHSDHSACSCVNATKDVGGVDAMTRCATTDAALPGCEDLKSLDTAFNSVTSPNLAPFVMNVRSAFKPRCYSSACVAADLAGSQDVLRPDVYQAAACNSTLNVCFNSIKTGGDIRGNINIQQDCAAGIGQSIPSELTSTSDSSGETVTVGGGAGSPGTTSGPSRQGCVNGTCTKGTVTFQESDLIIKPGTSEFVDKYLPTPNKQKGAIGGCIFCILICCCLILFMMMKGGGENSAPSGPVGPTATNLAQVRLNALLSKI